MKHWGFKHWWRDTLFKRLFVLMWAALFISHFAAYSVVNGLAQLVGGADSVPRPGMRSFPTMPSLPPSPGVPQIQRGLPEYGPPPDAHSAEDGRPKFGRPPDVRRPPDDLRPIDDRRPPDDRRPRGGPPPLPFGLLVLDYCVRLLLIGLAAWFGAQWLSKPVARLVAAARELTRSIGNQGDLPKLDETLGTVEVREAAHVFNDMGQQLNGQFRSRGLMMAALSHDLRTPLTRMRVRLESLEHEPSAQRCIADIREMDALLTNALQLFRDDDADESLQATDIFALVQSITDDLVEQGLPVTLVGEPVVAAVRPLALKRVMSNLVQNAIRYGERAEVSVRADAAKVEVTIDDHGRGIPEHELETVFQPFYRRDASRSRDTGGAGLGLYIARDLLTRQGGRLTLSNRPTGGLNACVQLPRRGQ